MKKKLLYQGILLAGALAILLPAVAGCTSKPPQPSAPAAEYTVKAALKALICPRLYELLPEP